MKHYDKFVYISDFNRKNKNINFIFEEYCLGDYQCGFRTTEQLSIMGQIVEKRFKKQPEHMEAIRRF